MHHMCILKLYNCQHIIMFIGHLQEKKQGLMVLFQVQSTVIAPYAWYNETFWVYDAHFSIEVCIVC